MSLRIAGAVAMSGLAAAAPDGFPDMTTVHTKCYTLLSGMSASPYNQAELSMLCRSKLPVEVCRMAAAELGPTPWSPSTMGRACGRWEEQWTERAEHMTPEERRLDGESWQAQIDEITKKKAAVGICTGKSVDECATYKREEYPKYTKQLNDAVQQKYKSWTEDKPEVKMGSSVGSPADALENVGVTMPTKDDVDEAKGQLAEKAEEAKDNAKDAVDNAKNAVDEAQEKVEDFDGDGEDVAEAVKDKLNEATQGHSTLYSAGHSVATPNSSIGCTVLVASGAALLAAAGAVAAMARRSRDGPREALVQSEMEAGDSQ